MTILFVPGADSGGYIIYNTLDVATGGDCGGDHVFDRPPLARLRLSYVFVRREHSALQVELSPRCPMGAQSQGGAFSLRAPTRLSPPPASVPGLVKLGFAPV